jgi:hypothetical protein
MTEAPSGLERSTGFFIARGFYLDADTTCSEALPKVTSSERPRTEAEYQNIKIQDLTMGHDRVCGIPRSGPYISMRSA